MSLIKLDKVSKIYGHDENEVKEDFDIHFITKKDNKLLCYLFYI